MNAFTLWLPIPSDSFSVTIYNDSDCDVELDGETYAAAIRTKYAIRGGRHGKVYKRQDFRKN